VDGQRSTFKNRHKERIVTLNDVVEYIRQHNENDETPPELMAEMFEVVYERKPDADDGPDLWSLICCAVDWQPDEDDE
jgi:hypothetical protein